MHGLLYFLSILLVTPISSQKIHQMTRSDRAPAARRPSRPHTTDTSVVFADPQGAVV